MSAKEPVFKPRTYSEIEAMYAASRRVRKATVLEFKDAAVASNEVDELGKAAIMRWYRGKISG